MGILRLIALPRKDCNDRIEAYLALKSPNTVRAYRAVFNEFGQFLAARRSSVPTCSETDAIAYANWALQKPGEPRRTDVDRNALPCTRATVLRKCVILRGFYKSLRGPQRNPFDEPVRRLRGAATGEKRPTNAMSSEDVKKLLELGNAKSKVGCRDQALIALLFGGGLRVSEALALRLQDVRSDGDVNWVDILNPKEKRPAEQVLAEWVVERLKLLISQRMLEGARGSSYLLCRYDSEFRPVEPLTYSSIRRHFKKMVAELGLPPIFSTHTGRATGITKLLIDGEDREEVQKFARHKSHQMVATYDKRFLDRRKAAGRRISFD